MARILYLDDEEPLVFLVKRMLELLGHQPAAFASPGEALAAFRTEPNGFDLVLTDLSMPSMNGIEFAQQILGARKGTAVAVLTGHADPKDIEAALAAGVLAVVAKPGTLQQMEQVVGSLLEKARGA